MTHRVEFPKQESGKFYMCEGGTETEVMYKHGFDFPYFAVFELLKNPKAVSKLKQMYEQYFSAVSEYNMSALVGGLDYRASPDWGRKLGYSDRELADINHECIEFIRKTASPFSGEINETLIQGLIGPRGDAYGKGGNINAEEAQEYHSVQLSTLKEADVDLVTAITFNNIEESIGVARAAKEIGLPLCISLSLDSSSRLNSGPSLGEAISAIDERTDSSVDFYMINCVHPLEYEPAFENENWMKRIRGVRPNASAMDKISLCKIGHLEDGDPVALGEQVGGLMKRHSHMDIFGGCCGTWDKHLKEIAKNVI
ncbi:homocysteine S-methyltransferase family protein [Oceanicoccus sp. KOV_DT_Chl]|uniref:homocysteine S-methyltransferase family protein n=1 Tax=Oceanicoccus sp. KOV_DT_Chl TaxID=1904639 RepID=UPI000C7B8918|nr:homocysteine S-methyltransferase family protein [Oceanicoccus sp. KOV_DT_Chl]